MYYFDPNFSARGSVLFNILSNAIKYVPDGGAIEIGAKATIDDSVEIRISDTGPGIPQSEVPRLFRPFERLAKGYACEHGGTGLGLSIVKSLMELHGGSVRIESQVGCGTTVILQFPPPASAGWKACNCCQVAGVAPDARPDAKRPELSD